jgi:transposase
MSWTVAIGVDTHKDAHVAVACDRLGRQLDALQFGPTPAGCVQLWSWAEALGEPAFALEGGGSYGAGLARFLTAAGACVYECERPHRRERRRGKSDLLDAALAARRLCAGEGLAQLRGGGKREELRLLLLERRSAQRARTCALNQLRAVVVAAPADLRSRLERLNGERLAERASRLRGGPARATLIAVLRRLGRRARTLAAEVAELDVELRALVHALGPELLREQGVGPVCAAQLLVSSGTPGRMRSEASFAALAGTSPVDASSGRQQRHRLNRGGDRQLNHALHVIALNRARHHPETADYYERLLASGKSKREALRCVKRMLARYFFCKLRTLEPWLQTSVPG